MEKHKKVYYTVCLAMIFCVLLSFPLWFNDRVYPVVYVFEGLVFYGWIQWVLIFTWLATLLVTLFPKIDRRYLLVIFLTLLVLLALQDQIRWQPWVYQYGIMLFFYLLYESKLIKEKVLYTIYSISIAGIYFWSGVHKVNAGFIEDILPGLVGFNMFKWGYLVPIAEATMGVLLFFRKTKKVAVFGLIGMHLLIIYRVVSGSILYDLVILPWNISMIVMLWVLFYNPDSSVGNFKEGRIVKLITVTIFLVLPVLNFFGKWHDFQSFTLFSGKEKRAFLFVNEELKNQFSTSSIEAFDDQNRLMLQNLSYPEIKVPTNSEISIYLRIFGTLCSRTENELDVILEIHQMEDLLENKRKVETYFCDDLPFDMLESTSAND